MNIRMTFGGQSSSLLRKASSAFVALSLVAISLLPAIAMPNVANAAANYMISGSLTINGLQVNASGIASANTFTGQANAQYVSIDWGDGGGCTPFMDENDLNYVDNSTNGIIGNTPWATSHTYATPGTYTIKALIHHSQCQGNESGAQVFTQTVTISYQCSDGVDNDNDGQTDYPTDSGCTGLTDDNETNPPPTTGGLTVTKSITNDNGGTATADDFFFTIPGVNGGNPIAFESDGTNEFTIEAGAYTVTEVADSGYVASYSAGCASGVTAGATTTCTITNNDKQGTLIVKKTLLKDSGGTLNAENFSFQVNGGSVTPFEADGQNNLFVNAGTYSVVEQSVAGWNTTYENCTDVVVPNGGEATCTITNNDIPGSITVTKTVNNAYRGTSVFGDFGLFVDIESVVSGVAEFFNAGTYSITEQGPTSGYNAVFGGDCVGASVTVGLGETKNCTITNSDKQPGTLHIIKVVQNDNAEEFAGSAVESDFTLTVTGGNPSPSSVAGSLIGADVELDAGANYSVAETGGPAGYGVSYSAGCSGVMPEGGEATCTVTNNDNSPTQGFLTVVKNVVSDNGGDALPTEWALQVTDGDDVVTGVTHGAATLFNPGTYTIGETGGPFGYAKTGTVCSTDGGAAVATESIVVAEGHSYVCTITNDDIAPSLTLTKVVQNNYGGTATADSWTLGATGPSLISGAGGVSSDGTFEAGEYTLSESAGPFGYVAGSWSCSGDVENVDNTVTLGIGQSATCEITNSDIAPKLTVMKHVVNDNGGSASASNFTMNVEGTEVSTASFPGDEDGTTVTLDAGAYSVTENETEGYGASSSEDCSGTIGVGEEKTCTITNDDGKATLTIIKNTQVADGTFEFTVSGGNDWMATTSLATAENTATTDISLDAGTYNVVETVPSGWALTDSSCVYDNESAGEAIENGEQISVGSGDHVTCTFTNVATSADVSVDKTVDDTTPSMGQTITYTIVVSNAGPAAANNVVVTDLLSSSLTYVSDNSTTTETSYATSTGEWMVGGLDNGASKELKITVTVKEGTAGQNIGNSATVSAENVDPDAQDNSDSVSVTVNTPDAPAPTPPSGGGGGGAPLGNGPIFQNAPAAGQVLGAAIEAVADCTKYLTAYIRTGRANDSEQVVRLQNFLNSLEGNSLTVNGTYDAPSLAAVNAFQVKYMADILTPWGATGPTGYVYYTTQKKVNEIYCKFTKQFPLSADQIAEIERIKALGGTYTPSASAGGTVEEGSETPSTPESSSAPASDTPSDEGEQEIGSASAEDNTASAVQAEKKSGLFGRFVNWLFGN